MIGKKRVYKAKNPARYLQGAGFQCVKFNIFSECANCLRLKMFVIRTFILIPKTEMYASRTYWLSCVFVKCVDTAAYTVKKAFHRGKCPVLPWQSQLIFEDCLLSDCLFPASLMACLDKYAEFHWL